MQTQSDQDKAANLEFLAMLEASLPDSTKEMLEEKGTGFNVPRSDSLRPRLATSAATKSWMPNKAQKKKKRQISKASRRKNRKGK